jgi:hypothetical protein
MILSVLHPPAPHQFAIFKQPLASILRVGSSLKPTQDHILHAVCRDGEQRLLDVIRLGLGWSQFDKHVELGVDSTIRVGVDLVRRVRAFAVVRNFRWLAAADDCEGRRRRCC